MKQDKFLLTNSGIVGFLGIDVERLNDLRNSIRVLDAAGNQAIGYALAN